MSKWFARFLNLHNQADIGVKHKQSYGLAILRIQEEAILKTKWDFP